ncbi:hypothetical protein NCAS_0I01440 [Naumovozyma castellii]|uniref:Uncharacterized protein n=1 Tax=Naumovozyma castellii TaxID=27288 RepID=G0VJY0_NAUCA|nr:hypothetical protein NCAS_0I01440 [Naumovozyma castellii CBS 4309]CCC71812.1 hypothetical protein NCAS_0I01440 [Naumovozyma castellii CBS 4309]
MIHSANVKAVLEITLKPIDIKTLPYKSPSLQSSLLLSNINGSILSYATSSDANQSNLTTQATSLSNLKMMSLLIKDKWFEDEREYYTQLREKGTNIASKSSNCYSYEVPSLQKMDNEVSEPVSPIQEANSSIHTLNDMAKTETVVRIYTYEIEELHVCVSAIPQSDLLLLFIADNKYPYGLLVMKMEGALEAFKEMYGYRLG